MKTKLAAILLGVVLGARPASAQVDAGAIGVAWDSTGVLCNWDQAPGTPGTLYILAYPSGQLSGGMTSAELRVDGFPTDWLVIRTTPHPPSSV